MKNNCILYRKNHRIDVLSKLKILFKCDYNFVMINIIIVYMYNQNVCTK